MEWDTVEDRTVSGKGVLKVPSEEGNNRAVVLYTDIIREAKNKYVNRDWNPQKSRYGNLVFLRENYVIGYAPIEFDGQAFDGISDSSGQTLIALKCAYEGILKSYVNLGVALGVAPVTVTDTIKNYDNLRNTWDEVRLKCYADTAIQLRLLRLKYDTCDPLKDREKPPPPPPPPRPSVPPGTPVPNTPPYDEDTYDGGDSIPYPGDEPQEPVQGEECKLYSVSIMYQNKQENVLYPGNPSTFEVWGEIGGVEIRVQPGDYSYFYIKCRGIRYKSGGGAEIAPSCADFRYWRIGSNGHTAPAIEAVELEITNVTLIG